MHGGFPVREQKPTDLVGAAPYEEEKALMEPTASRSMRTAAALTTTGALVLTPIVIAPPERHAPAIVATQVSTQAVKLTDAWSDLLNNTLHNVEVLGKVFLGLDNAFPLPTPTIPLAPIVTQLVLNPLIYTVQLITGQGATIPTEIKTHISQVLGALELVVTQLPPLIGPQLQAPFNAIRLALESIAGSGNLLLGLVEAPAVFLDHALNSEYGLLGGKGPVAVAIIVRNLFANALATPLPTVVLPFKKANGAAPKTLAPTTATAAAPTGVAGSARTKPKAQPTASAGAKKTGTAKAGTARKGVAHGRR
ncbi:hypothetical protein GCM10010533_09180 [Mycolicibacterium pallens]